MDATALDPSRAGAAGEMVTTLGDLNRFFAALLGGRLLPPRETAQLRSARRADDAYGLGLYAVELPCGTTVWGHNGDINGSYAQTAATADGRHVLSLHINTDTRAAADRAVSVLTAEFCRQPGRGPPDRREARQRGTMSGAPRRAASAVRSSGCRCDSRSASTRFS